MLIVPGPEPSSYPSPAAQAFLARKLEEVSTLLTVCTGVFPMAHSGLLTGKIATGPRPLLPVLRSKFPDVQWEEKRWARDGKIWTSGAITNGLDMMAAFIKESYPPDVAAFVCAGADVGDRGQEYGK